MHITEPIDVLHSTNLESHVTDCPEICHLNFIMCQLENYNTPKNGVGIMSLPRYWHLNGVGLREFVEKKYDNLKQTLSCKGQNDALMGPQIASNAVQACLKLINVCLLNLPFLLGKLSQTSNHFTIRDKKENAHHFVFNDDTNFHSNEYLYREYSRLIFSINLR